MFTARNFPALLFGVAFVAVFASCGDGSTGGGTGGQFDEQELNDNKSTIQTNVNQANLIFVGTITAVGNPTRAWSGISETGQVVTYTVGEILKDSNSATSVGAGQAVYHLIVAENRQTTSSAALSGTLFETGDPLIVLAKLDSNLAGVGTNWSNPTSYSDMDGQFSAIPKTANNLALIRTMISSPASSVSPGAALDNNRKDGLSPAKTFDLTGSAGDQAAWNSLMEECKNASAAFADLWNTIDSSATAVTFNLGRNQERIFVDGFAGKNVDLDDLEAWRTAAGLLGCNERSGLCQILAHVLQEYYYAAVNGAGYAESHASALDKENAIRLGVPKGTTLAGHNVLERDGNRYLATVYDGKRELVGITDEDHPGVGDFTSEDTP